MGLPDTSTVPKKDPMGMDYIPVYEGEQEAEPSSANQIRISSEKVQKLGVRTELAQLQTLDKLVRAAGRVEPDERRLYTISPKFEGYVERLHVNVTGQPVGGDGVVAGKGNRGIGRDWMPFRKAAKRAEMSAWTRSKSYCQ